MRRPALARHARADGGRPAVIAAVLAAVGVLVLATAVAWQRSPVGTSGSARYAEPAASSAYPVPSPALVADSPSGPSPSAAASAPARPSGPATSAPAPGPQPVAGATLVDFEDFNGTTIDAARWSVYQAPATNGVSQWSPSMVSVAGGELRIAGHGRDPDGSDNVSGGVCWCNGVGNQTYGIWQVRARFDAGIGYGQAILLWPESNRWPEDGELDFVETPGAAKTTALGTVHWGADNQQDERKKTGDFTAWHTYTVAWRAGYVKMSIDDTVYYDSTTSAPKPTIPTVPMQLAIQQEPGPFGKNWVPAPNASTPDQVVMHIDWVRIYR